MTLQSIGFIGGGRVARILLGGWRRAGALPAEVVVYDPDAKALDLLRLGVGSEITTTGDAARAAAADLVVLAAAVKPSEGITDLAQKFRVGYDEHGFLLEAHPKLRPVETNTAGIFLAGACHSPRDIPGSVSQASAAASATFSSLE